jgi:hypothetical protein
VIVRDRGGDNVVICQTTESLGVCDGSDSRLETGQTEGSYLSAISRLGIRGLTHGYVVGETSEDQLIKRIRGASCETSKEIRSVGYCVSLNYREGKGQTYSAQHRRPC